MSSLITGGNVSREAVAKPIAKVKNDEDEGETNSG